ncbi:UDP-glycosyltransferase UGT5-like [Neocloeon triangulifer]|uniref:UDP-glycosyltransferase UGT5-like n=1 Tax=Neocloeon triangulifer TaxID=2078957 RepID=UPI00286EFEE4|nr:UDP-glycosyltransferase UGT5-like [Neocloeon triangulifer]XP_059470207.1 UDP-glycosyltransferase UGT5-like [Neocloeon triangulifer]
MEFLKTSLVVFLALAVLSAESARILGVFPWPGKSHMITFAALTHALAERGHELVVVSTYPSKKPPANYTDIDIAPSLEEMYQAMMNNPDMYDFEDIPLFLLPNEFFWPAGTQALELAFGDQKMKDLLKDEKGFDLVISEDFMCDAVFGFAHHFKAPLVLISSFGGFHWQNYAVGNPYNPAYAVNNILEYPDKKTFYQRMINTLFVWYWDIGSEFLYYPQQEKLKEKFFGPGLPSLKELRRSASLVLVNNHFSLHFPRPLVPNFVEVGGMHVKPASKGKLPPKMQNWLDDGKEGVIYFSLGSNLRANMLPEAKRTAFLEAFAQLPQRVIWKWESETLPGKPDNVMISPWVPQMEVLAHPNVKLFITHGGLLSGQEAMYNGVPIVGIPVFGDQKMNIQRAVNEGYAVMLSLKNITKETVLTAILEGLNNPRIRTEVQRRKAVFLDQPETPLERAVFWTEYIIRHNGAPHLRSAVMDLTWYQEKLLDVYAVLLLSVTVLLLTFGFFVKFIVQKCKGGNKVKSKNE